MDREKEKQLAHAPYQWLRASPLLTISTLYWISSLGLGESLCYSLSLNCGYSYNTSLTLNIILGIVISGLWHLLLLQYVQADRSELVRKHGRQALIYAGIRTAIPLTFAIFDLVSNSSGVLACLSVPILIILWISNSNTGTKNVELDFAKEETEIKPTSPKIITPIPNGNREEILKQLYEELENEDDVTVLKAISKLSSYQISDEAILKRLENLADEDDNIDIRMDARVALNELKSTSSTNVLSMEENNMSNQANQTPQELLNNILAGLKSGNETERADALEKLRELKFSSEAIRTRLEQIALHDSNKEIRKNALLALDIPTQRFMYSKISNLSINQRSLIVSEIQKLVKDQLLDAHTAEVIKKRYDFDLNSAPQAKPQPASPPKTTSQPAQAVPQAKPAEPEAPRPTLLQTLTSESSVKIYLYLGAFFVIAAAAILGAAIPELRLPILIVGTILFGGLAVAIKKRLPQPSFALFIVFSFLLPITANSLEESLRVAFNYSHIGTAVFWVFIYLIMTAIWSGGTRLYDSRLFSITAFGAFVFAALRLADVFDTEPELYTLFVGIATFGGLAGTWLLKKWKDANFALPLFLASQLTQAIVLVASISIFGAKIFDPINIPIWHLIPFFVWGFASIYYIVSDRLYPFIGFSWLTAGALIPMPWFIATAFDIESLGSSILLLTCGIVIAIASEAFNRIETLRKYSLPFLLASMPAFLVSLITGFAYQTWLALIVSLVIAIVFTVLHILRTRWWLWALALLNFIIAYFAFFNLSFITNLNIFTGYQTLIISILLLLPDLFLKKDWQHSPEWRLPLRIYGALFVFFTATAYPIRLTFIADQTLDIAIIFAVYTIFFATYALSYKTAWLGYISTATLPISILFALDHFNIDAWLPILTFLSILYFLFGIAIQAKKEWSIMLRNSALILGTFISLTALFMFKETGGWYILVIGLFFIAEMVLRKNGSFEIGAPLFFNAGAVLILKDFNITQITTQLLIYSILWILADLLAHLTFKHPRPLSLIIRGVGGFIALINYVLLFGESDTTATIGFAIYALLFLTVSFIYRNPNLFYAFTLTLPIFVTFFLRIFDFTKWIHPVVMIAFGYYAIGFLLRARKIAKGWDLTFLYSGLGLGVFVSVAAPVLGGVDAMIPVAVAATLWAVEAFEKRNAWLAFPANGLYLLSYFILLNELNVSQPQFFSIGAALLGLLQHYLLTRAGSTSGAFLMGMISQFVLVGTTYIQMLSEGELIYLFVLFVQSMTVLVYGIVIRSRSLTFFPIGFVVLGVVTVVLGQLQEIATILLIGCAGVLLLTLGILAVLLRERIAKLSEKISDWQA